MNDDDDAILESFVGPARLFPLPNLVLFPNVDQLLHIFEQRYRQMTADALAGDRLIATALMTEGSKADLEGSPPIHPGVCLGRIIADKQLDDGRFLLMLRGLARARIIEEAAGDEPYRTARVQLLTDRMTMSPVDALGTRQHLASLILPRLSDPPSFQQMRELFQKEMPLGALCDFLAYKLPLSLACKQQLLEEVDVARRVRLLLDELATQLPGASSDIRKFPPDFSLN
jgi:uncharacterized protein